MTYKSFIIMIYNSKKNRTEYRDYAVTVRNELEAYEAAERYAKDCLKRYRKGSTFQIVEY